ncbi:hypothetical protein [Salinactinospora qingdaonensis]|uniref:Uncharacterized protein n=1 Tax=Salinactinospora qingdaonensis TaxID=702744 RepID=A0ABP7FQM1_9ACTN
MGTLSWIDPSLRLTPVQAVSMLHSYLTAAGMRRLYAAGHATVASLSIRAGLTVWCMGGTFRWSDEHGHTTTHPADDPEGAARRLSGVSSSMPAAA